MKYYRDRLRLAGEAYCHELIYYFHLQMLKHQL